MFSGIRNFLSRHRRKFLIGGITIAGGALALRYARQKLYEFQEAKTQEFFERTRRAQHFETTERTCNQAIMGLAPNLINRILQALDTESILAQLRQNPENKIELWNEIKVLAFSRLTALVYACSMLAITLRIQFNILGGYLYKDTVSGNEKIANEIQQNYVALIQYFLSADGVDALCTMIKSKVRMVLSSHDLNEKLTLAETEQIFWSIQMAVNSDQEDPNGHLATYVYPHEVPEQASNPILTKMFIETVDMLESDDISSLNTNNVSRGFSIVIDNIADFYLKPANGLIMNGTASTSNSIHEPSTSKSALNHSQSSDGDLININAVTVPLPKLIPIVDALAKQPFSNTAKPPGLTTSLVTLYLISDKVKMLGANVYEVFCQ